MIKKKFVMGKERCYSASKAAIACLQESHVVGFAVLTKSQRAILASAGVKIVKDMCGYTQCIT
jgi:hypothetical protein